MPRLDWDEIDTLGFFEVEPEVEEYEISHIYNVGRDGLNLIIKIWQLESVAQITLKYNDGDLLTNIFLYIYDNVRWIKSDAGETLRFKNCVITPSRFSYMDSPNLNSPPSSERKTVVDIKISPRIKVDIYREGDYENS